MKDGYFKGSLIGGTKSRTCDIVSNTGTGVAGNLCSFVSDKVIQDSGIASSSGPWLALAGGTMTAGATINMNTGPITNSGIITITNTTDATASTGSFVNNGGSSIAKKAFIGSNTVIGPTQTITSEQLLTLRGANTSTAGPHTIVYTATDQYPVSQFLNWAHDNIAHSFDSYFDGNWRSSLTTSNYQIYKTSNQLQFNYNSGNLAGSIIIWNTAGYIDTGGVLNWNKAIKNTAGVASTSTTTGSSIITGGEG